MGHPAAENRGPAERAERGPARTGTPPEAGGGPAGLEPRVVRLECTKLLSLLDKAKKLNF